MDPAVELEIFFRGQEIDQEITVEIGAGVIFPGFGLRHIIVFGKDETRLRPDQVEDQAEKGCFACAVISYEPKAFALVYLEGVNVQNGNP